jgi:hypothetical protein
MEIVSYAVTSSYPLFVRTVSYGNHYSSGVSGQWVLSVEVFKLQLREKSCQKP